MSGVHVIGDANGKHFLAPVAEYEAEVAIAEILEQPIETGYPNIPHVIFTDPEIACWGKTLKQVKIDAPNACERIIPLGLSSRYTIEHPTENGFGICVYSDKETLVGVHLVGTGVVELVNHGDSSVPHPSIVEWFGKQY